MDNKITEMLEKEVIREIEELGSIAVGEEMHKSAVDDIVKLHQRLLETDKANCDFDKVMEQQDLENKKFKNQLEQQEAELEEHRKDRKNNLIVKGLEIGLPLAVTTLLMIKGFKFEETGSFTSTTLRNLFSKLKLNK